MQVRQANVNFFIQEGTVPTWVTVLRLTIRKFRDELLTENRRFSWRQIDVLKKARVIVTELMMDL